MTPREIFAAMQQAALRDPPSASDRALLTLRDLLVGFLDATDGPSGYPDSMKVMSMDQIRFLNQLHLAVGL
jgi:hypothetical protein